MENSEIEEREEKLQKKEEKQLYRQEKRRRREEERARGRYDIRWDKLDNTAHLFPVIAGEAMSNVYRISVTLGEQIQGEILQKALDVVLPKFDGFNLRLRQGVF